MRHDDHAHEHHHHHHHHSHCEEHHHDHGCAGCDGCDDPKQELMALMRYMVNHNAQHANELAGLAKQLDTLGDHVAYEQVMQAVSDFEKGNLRLVTVLSSMES